jgi:hypothetical protein
MDPKNKIRLYLCDNNSLVPCIHSNRCEKFFVTFIRPHDDEYASVERCKFLTAARMTKTAFWDIVPCSIIIVDRRFRDAYPVQTSERSYIPEGCHFHDNVGLLVWKAVFLFWDMICDKPDMILMVVVTACMYCTFVLSKAYCENDHLKCSATDELLRPARLHPIFHH